MKLSAIFLTLVMAGSVQAANSSGGKLGLGLSSNQGSLLFPSSRKSCASAKDPSSVNASNDILPKYFELDNFNFAWDSTTSNLHILLVKVSSADPRLSISNPTLSTAEISNLHGSYNSWSGVMAKASDASHPTTLTTDCPLTFGGVVVSSANDVDFEAMATLTVVGVAYDVDANGNEIGTGTPVNNTIPFKITNIGNTNP